jgi:polysaccharide deacetylase family protein (PEP-CTERM system associated)
MSCVLTIDVEEWYHILEARGAPAPQEWDGLESRVERNLERLLAILADAGARATFFWLGWVAERHRDLLRRCADAGHEIASHGYGHVLVHHAGPERFREDVIRGKRVLEDIVGAEIAGFRAAGFSATRDTPWAFDLIREAGHTYDSSVFPAAHGHGGIPGGRLEPHVRPTRAGPLVECPVSAIEVLGRRISVFGGGYLRLAPAAVIRWAASRVLAAGRPLVVYLHPREIDPDQPRLPLSRWRRFKCYVNLAGTESKLGRLLAAYEIGPMHPVALQVARRESSALSVPLPLPRLTESVVA